MRPKPAGKAVAGCFSFEAAAGKSAIPHPARATGYHKIDVLFQSTAMPRISGTRMGGSVSPRTGEGAGQTGISGPLIFLSIEVET